MNINTSQLSNGLRVVSVNVPHLKSAAVAAFVNVGSRYETQELNGISHFLEHMAFKGTQKRTALDISFELEHLGADVNAYTSKDRTAYYVTGLKENVSQFAELISDVLLNSTFPEDEIDLERGVILQEIAQYADQASQVAYDLYDSVAYPNQSRGRNILGTPEFINRVQRQDFIDYMDKYYTGPNIVFGVVGDVTHEEAHALAEQYFSGFKNGTFNVPDEVVYHGGFAAEPSNFSQTRIILGFPCAGQSSHSHYAEAIAGLLLGGGMSAPLFQEVREKRGLVYTVRSFTDVEVDNGTFYIGAGTTPEHIDELLKVTIDEVAKLAKEVPQNDFERAMNTMRVEILRASERGFTMLRGVTENLFAGTELDLDKELEIFASVTKEDVRQAFVRLLQQTPSLVFAGPGGKEEHYQLVLDAIAQYR